MNKNNGNNMEKFLSKDWGEYEGDYNRIPLYSSSFEGDKVKMAKAVEFLEANPDICPFELRRKWLWNKSISATEPISINDDYTTCKASRSLFEPVDVAGCICGKNQPNEQRD